MNRLWMREDLARGWSGRDAFAAAAAQQGELLKHKDGRRTLRFAHGGRSYVLKYHPGVGWRELFKNLLQLRSPVLDAGHEYRAARRLGAAGVPSLTLAGAGARGCNPARRCSFVVTDDLGGRISLEQFCARWPQQPPSPRGKRLLIARVAQLARGMHAAGVNHRDFYLCHLLLAETSLAKAEQAADIDLRIIDLHRAECRARVPRRQRIKDLAALAFSAGAIGLTRRDRLRFVRAYGDGTLRDQLLNDAGLWRQVVQRTQHLLRRG